MPMSLPFDKVEKKSDEKELFIENKSADSGNFQDFSAKSDGEIWESFIKGNESAFIYLYRHYFDSLGVYGIQLHGDVALIEDAIQDVFVDLRKKRQKLPPIKCSIKAYLYKCLRNKILEYLRKESSRMKRNVEHYSGFDIVLPFEETMIRNEKLSEDKKAIIEAVNNLPVRQKEIIHYLFYENLSYEEIKEIMGFKNLKSSRNLIYKALSKLRIALQLARFLFLAVLFSFF